MTDIFLQKIFKYIEDNGMIAPGDRVFAGVSGGADSMCLLLVLLEYQKRVNFWLEVLHVEHGIRGAESRADADYVEQYCKKLGIICKVTHINAAEYAKDRGLSLEEAARILRYEIFRKQAEAANQAADAMTADGLEEDMVIGSSRIAVAHHREDQAETVLWQLLRGSDIRGMGGMQPVRKGKPSVIRPLLETDRKEIEQFLRERQVSWREDRTNQEPEYTRNRIRMELLPVMEDLNQQAVRHICETAAKMRETEDYFEQQLRKLYPQYVSAEGLIREECTKLHPLMRRRICYQALAAFSGSARDLGAVHVKKLEQLFEMQTGRKLDLPYQICARRVYQGIQLEKIRADHTPVRDGLRPEQVHIEVIEAEQLPEISKKKYTKYFNYDKITDSVQLRYRQPGDYLVIDKEGHTKKLKKYLVDEKIPENERGHLLLLADGSHILWVIGYRISDYYKVDAHTKRILKVQIQQSETEEEILKEVLKNGGNKDE